MFIASAAAAASSRRRGPRLSFSMKDEATVRAKGEVFEELITELAVGEDQIGGCGEEEEDGEVGGGGGSGTVAVDLPKSKYERALAMARVKYGDENVSPVFPTTWRAISKELPPPPPRSSILERLPPKMRQMIKPHQLEFLERAVQLEGRLLLADDMGLGKTFQAIALASYYGTRVLVVSPAGVIGVWPKNVNLYTDWSVGLVGERGFLGTERVSVVAYDKLRGMIQKGEKMDPEWEMVVMDECHLLAGSTTARTNNVVFDKTSPIRTARRVLVMSGTPQINCPADLWAIYCIITGNFEVSFESFTKRYGGGRVEFGKWTARGATHKSELNVVLKRLMVRRLEGILGADLPTKKIRRIEMELGPRDRIKVDEVHAKWKEAQRRNFASKTETSFKALQLAKSACFVAMGTAKMRDGIPYFLGKIEALRAKGQKGAVFCEHIPLLEAFSAAFSPAEAVTIRSKVDGKKRQKMLDPVAAEGGGPVAAILSTNCAGAGIELQPAVTYELFAEQNWGPGKDLQAQKRAHRMGAKYPVTVDYLIVPWTIDEDVLKKSEEKKKVFRAVIDGVGDEGYVPKFDEVIKIKARGARWFPFGIDARWRNAEDLKLFFGDDREKFAKREGGRARLGDVLAHAHPEPIPSTQRWRNALEEVLPAGISKLVEREVWVVPKDEKDPTKWAAAYVDVGGGGSAVGTIKRPAGLPVAAAKRLR